MVKELSIRNADTPTLYGTTVYCGLCGCMVGKVLQSTDWINIICIDCAEKEDKRRETTAVATT